MATLLPFWTFWACVVGLNPGIRLIPLRGGRGVVDHEVQRQLLEFGRGFGQVALAYVAEMQEAGGTPVATVIGHAARLPVLSAAVVNGAALESIDGVTDNASVLVSVRVTVTDMNGVNKPSEPYRMRVIVHEDDNGRMTGYDLKYPDGGN